ncbi:uncharacterized protein LOC34623300 [Cyclospora cayetanensis]|uniref:Uncharacterized protein LOC34623300 n=1 Tax=Cyclospora cayetanensis TaxID=88456 RepID=A0A6P6RVY5_9EIME|nr:uncharacterized protein LOC34623300 [Cyclospora cayetanensis]
MAGYGALAHALACGGSGSNTSKGSAGDRRVPPREGDGQLFASLEESMQPPQAAPAIRGGTPLLRLLLWSTRVTHFCGKAMATLKPTTTPLPALSAATPAAKVGGSSNSVLPPELAERYCIEREAGRGVYGTVYVCRLREPSPATPTEALAGVWPEEGPPCSGAPSLGPPPEGTGELRVAVKKVRLPCFRLKGVFGLDQQAVRELSALRTLSHANIVALKAFHFSMEAWQHSEDAQPPQEAKKKRKKKLRPTFYFITELCDADLAEVLAQQQSKHQRFLKYAAHPQHRAAREQPPAEITSSKRPHLHREPVETAPLPGFSEEDAKLIVYQLLQALAHCHSRGVLHRDVKPQNIFLSKETDAQTQRQRWVVRLGDFGLSSPFLSCEGQRTADVVTRLYRAPELLLGQTSYGPAVDVWSAAAVADCSRVAAWKSAIWLLLGSAAAGAHQTSPGTNCRGAAAANGRRTTHLNRVMSVLRTAAPSFCDCSLLVVQPAERPSCVAALMHPWLTTFNIGKEAAAAAAIAASKDTQRLYSPLLQRNAGVPLPALRR